MFTLLIGKTLIFLLGLLNRGTSLPGDVALRMNKNIWKYFKITDNVIAVTGSSGKGSTGKLLTQVLRNEGYNVITNAGSSNLDSAVLSLLIKNAKLNGNVTADYIVLEVDERYCKHVFPYVKPKHVIVTNITRDQPPRQGNPDLVYAEIIKALPKGVNLILNGDDPYLRKFNINNEYSTTYFGISKTKYSYSKSRYDNLNISYCPYCNTKLSYNFYHFEATGDYYCPNCDFKRNDIKFEISEVDYERYLITLNNETYKLTENMLYFIYNSLGVITISKLLGISYASIKQAIEKEYNQYSHVTLDINDRKVEVLNNKAENASTYNQSILYINRFSNAKVLVIGWKEISRRYDYDDLSWLFDIDFESLDINQIEAVVTMGINAYDIASRLKYCGIADSKLKPFIEVSDATEYIKDKTVSDIYAILNFDHMQPFINNMKEDNK